MLKQITFLCLSLYTSLALADTAKGLSFRHTTWQDTLVEKAPKRLCRTTATDCATITRKSDNIITLKWDNWSIENFLLTDGVYTQIDPKEIAEMFLYDFENPQITVNPYGNNPLAAEVKFETDRPARIQLRIKGIPPAEDVVAYFNDFATKHRYPIFGLYPKHKNTIEMIAFYQDGETAEKNFTIQTKGIQHPLFYSVITKTDDKNMYYWISDGLILDEYGYVRFYYSGGFCYWFQDEIIAEHITSLERLSPLGESLQKYPFPDGFYSYRHGLGRMPNKNILIIGTFPNSLVINNGRKQASHRDYILELDYKTGKEVKRWDLAAVLNPDRQVIVRPGNMDFGKNDWIHTNSIMYDPAEKALILSGRHIGMASIDYKTGALNWVMGPRLGYEKSGRFGDGPDITNKVLTAVDKMGTPLPENVQKGYEISDAFKWPTKTHDAKALGNGYYSIFDNNGEAYDFKIKSAPNSRPVIYRIDPEKKTIQQVWSRYLDRFSEVGSAVFWRPGTSDVFSFISQAQDKNTNETAGYLYRFDFETQQKRFEAALKRPGQSWYYTMDPTHFYPPINQTPPEGTAPQK